MGIPGTINASAKSATAIHNGAFPVVPDTTASIRATTANTKLIDIVEPPSGLYTEARVINKHGDGRSKREIAKPPMAGLNIQ
jgi:hypothetical protein